MDTLRDDERVCQKYCKCIHRAQNDGHGHKQQQRYGVHGMAHDAVHPRIHHRLVFLHLNRSAKEGVLAKHFRIQQVRNQEGNCTADMGIIFIEMLGELSKIGERLANISERTPEIQKHYIDLN